MKWDVTVTFPGIESKTGREAKRLVLELLNNMDIDGMTIEDVIIKIVEADE